MSKQMMKACGTRQTFLILFAIKSRYSAGRKVGLFARSSPSFNFAIAHPLYNPSFSSILVVSSQATTSLVSCQAPVRRKNTAHIIWCFCWRRCVLVSRALARGIVGSNTSYTNYCSHQNHLCRYISKRFNCNFMELKKKDLHIHI